MNTKHTPGPWQALADHPENAVMHVYAADKVEIATLFNSPSSPMTCDGDGIWGADPERDSNARLIAAAPELLDAIGEMLELVDDLTDSVRLTDRVVTLEASWRALRAKAAGGAS